MKKYKGIPIARAKEIARDFDKDQVIIVTWDKAHGRTHVTTYGKTVEECAQAAEGGNRVKRALGWPEELCKAKPARSRRAKKVDPPNPHRACGCSRACTWPVGIPPTHHERCPNHPDNVRARELAESARE